MNMADEAIGYLGQSSTDAALDAFLTLIGIKKRPKDTSISTRYVEGSGITFSFLERYDYLEIYTQAPNSEGELILDRVDFDQIGATMLPYGLNFGIPLETMKTILGEPLVAMADIPPPNTFRPKFYFDGHFMVAYLDKKTMLLEHLVVSKATKLNQQHFGLK